MLTLGIETSCDETGVAVYDFANKKLLSNSLYSQIDLHHNYGGVVPELASREHISKLYPLTKLALDSANLSFNNIDGIAYTSTPGLVGALMVGSTFAKTLGFIHDIPCIAINHLEGHLLSPLLDKKNKIRFPFIALIVSGGHTQVFKVINFGQYKLLGESIDDAAGETFDKIAKFLGMRYPGGVEVANLASKAKTRNKYLLPTPMKNKLNLDFSFSGLKTAVFNTWYNEVDKTESNKANLCYAFQKAVIDVLISKCYRALQDTDLNNLVICGGVSANIYLRNYLNKSANSKKYKVFFPPLQYCTDNGAMIALAGAYRIINQQQDQNLEINVLPRSNL